MQPTNKFVSGTYIPAVWLQPQETQTNEDANERGTPSQITIVRIPSTMIQSKEQSLPPHNIKINVWVETQTYFHPIPSLTNPE